MVDPRLIGVDNDLNERNLSRQGQRGKQWENNLFYFLRRVFLSASFQELGTALKIYDWSFFSFFRLWRCYVPKRRIQWFFSESFSRINKIILFRKRSPHSRLFVDKYNKQAKYARHISFYRFSRFVFFPMRYNENRFNILIRFNCRS